MQKTSVLYKSLVVGVIVLFIGVGIQPAFAEMKNEVMKTSAINSDDTKYLANLSMDFGEYITNNRIDYKERDELPEGNYTINVKINFSCPENLKIVVKYSYFAQVQDLVTGDKVTFCNVEDMVTIINGSNPPDINVDYTKFCPKHEFLWEFNEWRLDLRIKANLTAYEYLDGEWVKSHNDEIFNETKDFFEINRIRPSERTKKPNNDCNLCPKASKQQIIRLINLLDRLEKYESQLAVVSKLNPELEEKYQELSENIMSLKELNKNLELDKPLDGYPFPIICNVLEVFAILLNIIASIALILIDIHDKLYPYDYYWFPPLCFIAAVILLPFSTLWATYCKEWD